MNDVQLAWAHGSIHLRTVAARGCSERRIVREDLAIGILFPGPGSTVHWRVDGKVVLDKTYASSGGSHDLLILPAGHELAGRCRGQGQGLWLFVEPQAIAASSRAHSFAERPRVDSSWARDHLSWAIASELRNECMSGFPRGTLFLQSAATALLTSLAYLLDRIVPATRPARPLSGAKLASVLDYIQEHLDRNITLAELAALAGLTPRYFCEVFRRATGRPPHQYQIEQRIERAKSLLQRPGVPLRDIALMAGFSSQSHLNVYFRRIAGMTPASYRAQSVSTAECVTSPPARISRTL